MVFVTNATVTCIILCHFQIYCIPILNNCFMETIHHFMLFFEQNQVWLYMAEKVPMTIIWSNSKVIEKNKISKDQHLKAIILSVKMRYFVLCWKSILVLKYHSLKHKFDNISWNINLRYNFSLTLAIKQDIWYTFSEASTLSIKIHLQFCSRQTHNICRHTHY